MTFGDLANFSGGITVGGIYGAVHAEEVEYLLGFIDKTFGLGNGHKLGQVCFSQFVYIVQFAVREQSGTTDTAEDVTGLALDTFLIG